MATFAGSIGAFFRGIPSWSCLTNFLGPVVGPFYGAEMQCQCYQCCLWLKERAVVAWLWVWERAIFAGLWVWQHVLLAAWQPVNTACGALWPSFEEHMSVFGTLFILLIEAAGFALDMLSYRYEGVSAASLVLVIIMFGFIPWKITICHGGWVCSQLTLVELIQLVLCIALVVIGGIQVRLRDVHKNFDLPLSFISLLVSVTAAGFHFTNKLRFSNSYLNCRDQIYKLQDLQSRNMPAPTNEPGEIEALICGCTPQHLPQV